MLGAIASLVGLTPNPTTSRVAFSLPTVHPDPAGESAGFGRVSHTRNPYRLTSVLSAAKHYAWLAGWKLGRARRLRRAA